MKRTALKRKTRLRPRADHETRERDVAYLAWLHDLPCIACLLTGPPLALRGSAHDIEAAHQKHCSPTGGMLGKRPPDRDSCPLCAWHHRLAPDACDPAQRKFWDRLNVDVGDYCRSLYQAYEVGASGLLVVQIFASLAKETA